MAFSDYADLMTQAASYYDDADVIDTGWVLPVQHQKRIYHYINRAQEEIWYYRPWSWRMARLSVNFYAGAVQLPLNFSNVGPNGLLFGPENDPWAEISFQDMMVLQQRNMRTQDHLFAVGNAQLDGTDEVAGVPVTFRKLMIPDPAAIASASFLLLYEMTAPLVTVDDATEEIGIPRNFHNALLMGTVAKMQEAKGDARSIWRSDFIATLAKIAAEEEHLTSRPRQMPVTIGGMW
jgi:hypothetical protein